MKITDYAIERRGKNTSNKMVSSSHFYDKFKERKLSKIMTEA